MLVTPYFSKVQLVDPLGPDWAIFKGCSYQFSYKGITQLYQLFGLY